MKSNKAQETRTKFGKDLVGENIDDMLYDEEEPPSSKGGGG